MHPRHSGPAHSIYLSPCLDHYEKDGVTAWYNVRERLWTVERFNLRQIKMETGQQVKKHIKTCWKQQKTKESVFQHTETVSGTELWLLTTMTAQYKFQEGMHQHPVIISQK